MFFGSLIYIRYKSLNTLISLKSNHFNRNFGGGSGGGSVMVVFIVVVMVVVVVVVVMVVVMMV